MQKYTKNICKLNSLTAFKVCSLRSPDPATYGGQEILTTLRSKGSNVEQSFCRLSIFTASTITLQTKRDVIHETRVEYNSNKPRPQPLFYREYLILVSHLRSPQTN